MITHVKIVAADNSLAYMSSTYIHLQFQTAAAATSSATTPCRIAYQKPLVLQLWGRMITAGHWSLHQ